MFSETYNDDCERNTFPSSPVTNDRFVGLLQTLLRQDNKQDILTILCSGARSFYFAKDRLNQEE